ELGLGEVAVGVDRAGPLEVVEHLTAGDGGGGGHHGAHRRGLRDDPRGSGGERLPHEVDPVGDRVHEHGGTDRLHALHVLGDAGTIAERQVEHDDVDLT